MFRGGTCPSSTDLGTLGYVVEDAARPGTALVVETGRPAVKEPDPVPAELVLPREVTAGNPGRAVERLDAPLRRLAVRATPFSRRLTETERRRVQEMVCRPGGCVSPFGLDRQLIIGGRSMSTCRRPLGDPPES